MAEYKVLLGHIKEHFDPTNVINIDHNLSYNESAAANYDTIVARGSLGALYTYNSTKERIFPLEIEIVDYLGDGNRIDIVKRLLRKWVQAKTKNGYIVSPPPVLEFDYVGMTGDSFTGAGERHPVICTLLSYNISVTQDTGWNISPSDVQGSNMPNAHPKIMNVNLELAEIKNTARNI